MPLFNRSRSSSNNNTSSSHPLSVNEQQKQQKQQDKEKKGNSNSNSRQSSRPSTPGTTTISSSAAVNSTFYSPSFARPPPSPSSLAQASSFHRSYSDPPLNNNTTRPSSSSSLSSTSLFSGFINRRKSQSQSQSTTTAPAPSHGSTTTTTISPSPNTNNKLTATTTPEAAKAYLAALAARSNSANLVNHYYHHNPASSDSSSVYTADDTASAYSARTNSSASASSYEMVAASPTSTSTTTTTTTSSTAALLASSLPSPTSLLRRKRIASTSNSLNGNGNGEAAAPPHSPNSASNIVSTTRKRSISQSIAQFAHSHGLDQLLDSEEEKVVYSNDYHIRLSSTEANLLSSHPPIKAYKITPRRHFDKDPFYVPDVLKNDNQSLRHSEFGYQDPNQHFEYKSQFRKSTGVGGEEIEEPSHFIYLSTYISYLLLIVVGHMRDFIGKRTHRKSYQHLMPYNGYAALNSDFDSFYTRRLKARIEDLFARPVTGVAGRTITCLDRVSLDHYATFRFTGLTTQALNISSYNYLGFNQSKGGCADAVEEIIKQYGVSSLGNREDTGTLDLHIHAERLISKFLGTEDSLLISQGFATNSATLPVLVSKGCLVISDELNHASIRFGVRLSGAVVKQYKHNDMKDLEKLLRESISQGQPRTHRPWKKIMLIVEGLYSMEGTLVDLPRILELKQKYKFYLYVDEAHSVGALGPRGRGVCDYFNIDPRQIDILMGTLTKSFGAAGGYIAGNKELIAEMKRSNHSSVYGEAHSPAVLMQIISSIVCIMGREALEVIPGLEKFMTKKMLDGTEGLQRLRRLAFNSRYLSTGLRKLGFIVYGHRDSPIVPLLMFSPGKMGSFSRLMLEKFNIVTVVVAYPATPLVSSRVRFCVSAAHTKQDIDRVLIACDVIGDVLGLKLSSQHKRMKIDDIIRNARELVEKNEL